MTHNNQHDRLHPLSKTRHLSTESTLVSLFCHPETIKSDDTQWPTWSSTPFVEDAMSIDRDYFSISFLSSNDNHVRWHAATDMVVCTMCRRRVVYWSRLLWPLLFIIHRQSSSMTRKHQYGHLLPLSKTGYLSTETTLVSPFHHPETIKSDDTQWPTWSSAPFVEGATSIDRDYFLLYFSSSRDNQVQWHAATKMVVSTLCRRPDVYRPRLL